MRDFALSARQYNAIRVTLDGMHAAICRRGPDLIDDTKRRLASSQKRLAKTEDTFVAHHLKRRVARLQRRLEQQAADLTNGAVRIAFGSKRLFRAQNALLENGYANHEAWLQAWRQARSDSFFVLGSSDENAGCQGCVIRTLGNDLFRLRLRLPNALLAIHGKHIGLDVHISYGAEHIVHALEVGQAISYRFKRDAKGWRVFVSTQEIQVEEIIDRRLGTLGVDLNADHLALALTDRFGNLIEVERVPLVTYGCSGEQAGARIGNAVKRVVAKALAAEVPIVIEQLDFTKKKTAMREQGVRYSRMLSSLSYSKIKQTLLARALDAGVKVLTVTPSYSSVIGRHKFSRRYGISGHQGAALVLARRARGFSERVSRHGQVAFSVPVRKRQKHVWSSWARIAKEEKRRMNLTRRSRERDPKLARLPCRESPLSDLPPVAGAIPAARTRREHCSPGVVDA
jgi:IS605 OrfB family transposase